MFAKIILIISLISGTAAAETGVYLINRSEFFPQDRYAVTLTPLEFKMFSETGNENIKEASGQPYKMTSYKINYSGKYALWTVTYKDASEKASIESMCQKKYIQKLTEIKEIVSSRTKRTDIITITLNPIPSDFYAVKVSTK